jgi:hypothetical protein
MSYATSDLFGAPVIDRQGKRNETPRGYAGQPGRGPAGETCKTCFHAYFHERSKRYWKCGHVRAPKQTCGFKTDIRIKSPACQFWQAKTESKL